ncbi:putative non-specific serine/threonine protein kinase [Helianthus anomalus]
MIVNYGVELLIDYRRRALQRRAAEAKLSSEEEEQLLRNLEKKETEYMRLQRHKLGIDDFELLTLIGKCAFGENVLVKLNYDEFDLF